MQLTPGLQTNHPNLTKKLGVLQNLKEYIITWRAENL